MAEELQIQKDSGAGPAQQALGKREEGPGSCNRGPGGEHGRRGLEAGRTDPAGRDRDYQGPAQEKNTHIGPSALEIIIAMAASGAEEALISDGLIASLDAMQEAKNPLIPEEGAGGTPPPAAGKVEEIVALPDDDY